MSATFTNDLIAVWIHLKLQNYLRWITWRRKSKVIHWYYGYFGARNLQHLFCGQQPFNLSRRNHTKCRCQVHNKLTPLHTKTILLLLTVKKGKPVDNNFFESGGLDPIWKPNSSQEAVQTTWPFQGLLKKWVITQYIKS